MFSYSSDMIGTLPAMGVGSYGRMRLPSEPIGTFELTLKNLVPGSRVSVERQDGSAMLHNAVASTSSAVISLDAYGTGSGFNSLRVRVRKSSSAPKYKPYETLVTARVGEQEIYVAQEAAPLA